LRSGRSLTSEDFLQQERSDAETWHRLTKRQRRQPKWRQREAQHQNAAKVGLIMLMAGEELPEPVRRILNLPEQPAGGFPSGTPAETVAALLTGGLFADRRRGR
jgi:hypothetical protein